MSGNRIWVQSMKKMHCTNKMPESGRARLLRGYVERMLLHLQKQNDVWKAHNMQKDDVFYLRCGGMKRWVLRGLDLNQP